MLEHRLILHEIEKLIDQLPYETVRIEVVLPRQTLTLEKDRNRPVGFLGEGN